MQCERGLVFESNLKSCVLPDNNWECELNDESEIVKPNNDEKNIYGINNIPSTMDYNDRLTEDDENLSVNISSENVYPKNNISAEIIKKNEFDSNYLTTKMIDYTVNTTPINQATTYYNDISYENDEFSGDGPLTAIEIKLDENSNHLMPIPESIDFDNSLTSHLQRLSQLVASAKNKKVTTNMDADELNSFLANFKIQSSKQNTNFNDINKHTLTNDGKLHPQHVDEIINKQSKLTIKDILSNLATEKYDETTTAPPSFTQTPPPQTLFPIKTPKVQLELKSQSPVSSNRKPEMNVHSSQIIVNRPGSSVLFSLDPGQSIHAYQPVKNGPYISEETLRTVLALSKQMIEHQNIQNSYPQPIVKPVYYTVPIPIMTNMNTQYSTQLNEDLVDVNDPTKSVISGFMNNMPIRHKIPYVKSPHIPITVTNSFNTYKDYNLDSQDDEYSNVQKSNYPTNNISTTVIFDRFGQGIQNPDQILPLTTTTTTTQSPTIINKYYNSYGSSMNDENGDYFPNYNTNVPDTYEKPPQIDPYYNRDNYHPISFSNNFDQSVFANNQKNSNYPNQNINGIYTHNQLLQNPPYETYQTFNSFSNPQSTYSHMPQINPPQQSYTQQMNPQQNFQNYNNYYNPVSPLPPNLSEPIYNRPSQDENYNKKTITKSSKKRPHTPSQIRDEDDDDNEENETDEDSDETIEDDNDQVMEQKLTHHKKLDKNRPSSTDTLSSNIDSSGILSSISSPFSSLTNIYGVGESNEDTKSKLVNIGGNYVNYENFKSSLFPFVQPNVEVITCVSSARQPNTTDCSRYYVCNPTTKTVLSYNCPPYTAFNKEAKICDARTYAFCKPEAIANRYTVAENIRAQMEAQKAVQDVNRLQAEALKTQALTQILRLQAQTQNQFQSQPEPVQYQRPSLSQTDEIALELPSMMQTYDRPTRKRIHCADTGKIPDPDSHNDYWVCFRSKEGRMKRQKMKCSSGLIFCARMKLCTIKSRCML